jgi:hypothetical protein
MKACHDHAAAVDPEQGKLFFKAAVQKTAGFARKTRRISLKSRWDHR